MKKIKILIATMLSAIVLVFAAVFGGSVNAAIVYDNGQSENCIYTLSEKKQNGILAQMVKEIHTILQMHYSLV